MSKLEYILIGVGIIMVFKLIKEMMYIRLYAFILKLQSEGKLEPESDPKGIAKKIKDELYTNRSKYF